MPITSELSTFYHILQQCFQYKVDIPGIIVWAVISMLSMFYYIDTFWIINLFFHRLLCCSHENNRIAILI